MKCDEIILRSIKKYFYKNLYKRKGGALNCTNTELMMRQQKR